MLLPSWTFQSKRLSNSRLPCYENTLRHLLSDVKDELEPNNRQEAVTTQYRKPGGNLQHKTDWKRETIMVLLPLTCQNIIDLRSTLVARAVCCLTPSTYYFQVVVSRQTKRPTSPYALELKTIDQYTTLQVRLMMTSLALWIRQSLSFRKQY